LILIVFELKHSIVTKATPWNPLKTTLPPNTLKDSTTFLGQDYLAIMAPFSSF
jgi:hypothetical protein